MDFSFLDIRCKEVVNIVDGRCLGHVTDIICRLVLSSDLLFQQAKTFGMFLKVLPKFLFHSPKFEKLAMTQSLLNSMVRTIQQQMLIPRQCQHQVFKVLVTKNKNCLQLWFFYTTI